MAEQWMTVTKAAAVLGMAEATVRRMIDSEQLKGRIGDDGLEVNVAVRAFAAGGTATTTRPTSPATSATEAALARPARPAQPWRAPEPFDWPSLAFDSRFDALDDDQPGSDTDQEAYEGDMTFASAGMVGETGSPPPLNASRRPTEQGRRSERGLADGAADLATALSGEEGLWGQADHQNNDGSKPGEPAAEPRDQCGAAAAALTTHTLAAGTCPNHVETANRHDRHGQSSSQAKASHERTSQSPAESWWPKSSRWGRYCPLPAAMGQPAEWASDGFKTPWGEAPPRPGLARLTPGELVNGSEGYDARASSEGEAKEDAACGQEGDEEDAPGVKCGKSGGGSAVGEGRSRHSETTHSELARYQRLAGASLMLAQRQADDAREKTAYVLAESRRLRRQVRGAWSTTAGVGVLALFMVSGFAFQAHRASAATEAAHAVAAAAQRHAQQVTHDLRTTQLEHAAASQRIKSLQDKLAANPRTASR